jgi:hypothetical protein
LNVAGYFDPLLALLEHAASEGFVRPHNLGIVVVSTAPETVVADLICRDMPASPRQPIDFP